MDQIEITYGSSEIAWISCDGYILYTIYILHMYIFDAYFQCNEIKYDCKKSNNTYIQVNYINYLSCI